ncbi:unnamed protein product, partial [marine sediment metagenome]
QDEYDKKAHELKQRQYELNDKLKRIIEADENYSITLISLLNICSKAPELFESSKVEQKRQLINFLLSNLKLRGKKLEFKLRKPFDVLVNLDYRSNWLGILNTFRTIYYQNIIEFIPQIKLIKESLAIIS